MEKKIVSDIAETLKGLIIFVGDGFVTYVSTCHDQCLKGTIQKKMVER